MNKEIMMMFAIIAGLFFSSCNNNSSENKKTEVQENETIDTNYTLQSVDDDLANNLKEYITTKFLTDADLRAISEEDRKFQFYKVDLNNDGNEEVFVSFGTSYFCGSGGCTVLLLSDKLELITKFSPTQALFIGTEIESGWITLHTRADGDWKKLIYEGDSYPSNPTLVKIAGDLPENAKEIFDHDTSVQKTYNF